MQGIDLHKAFKTNNLNLYISAPYPPSKQIGMFGGHVMSYYLRHIRVIFLFISHYKEKPALKGACKHYFR